MTEDSAEERKRRELLREEERLKEGKAYIENVLNTGRGDLQHNRPRSTTAVPEDITPPAPETPNGKRVRSDPETPVTETKKLRTELGDIRLDGST